MGNGGPPLLREKCKELKDCKGKIAENEVTGSRVMANYMSQFFNDFSTNLEVKAIGMVALICCIFVCGANCCKGFSRIASDPKSYMKRDKRNRDDDSIS